tara:strand:+ start:3736 stop:4503 length:768 start_codon:yes stop_codon:yes gene_type:complete
MTVCSFESNTSLWIKLLRLLQAKRLWPQHEVQTQRQAQMGLRECIQHLEEKEMDLRKELRDMAEQVKKEQKNGNKSRLRMLLMSSSAKRSNLSTTARKRLALEQQLEALSTTQLNQEVLSSMQQTSAVLKSMGLEDKIATTDEVMQDLEDSQRDIASLQETLSTAISGAGDYDDSALEAELELLLNDVPDMEAPVTVNSLVGRKQEKPESAEKPQAAEVVLVGGGVEAAVPAVEEAMEATESTEEGEDAEVQVAV